MHTPVILLGAGGHAKVLIEVLRLTKRKITGILTAKEKEIGGWVGGIPILGDDRYMDRYRPGEIELVNGIGSAKNPELRMEVFNRYRAKGFRFPTLIHPSAIIAQDFIGGEGVQVMAGCIIQPGCTVGDNVILNTRVSVDHDSQIGAHCHLAPGVVLSGNVRVGDATHIGTGTSVIQGIKIGTACFIAAGSIVTKDITDHQSVRGNPAIPY